MSWHSDLPQKQITPSKYYMRFSLRQRQKKTWIAAPKEAVGFIFLFFRMGADSIGFQAYSPLELQQRKTYIKPRHVLIFFVKINTNFEFNRQSLILKMAGIWRFFVIRVKSVCFFKPHHECHTIPHTCFTNTDVSVWRKFFESLIYTINNESPRREPWDIRIEVEYWVRKYFLIITVTCNWL